MYGRVLGRLADQPGKRDQRDSRQDKERRVTDMREVVERDHARTESQACEENAAYHGRRQRSDGDSDVREGAATPVPSIVSSSRCGSEYNLKTSAVSSLAGSERLLQSFSR
jgi:hypothetical protein